MDSRPILKNTGRIRVFIDSKSFDELLKQNDRLAIAILSHYDSEILDFIRNPLATKFEALNNIDNIVSYELENKDSKHATLKMESKYSSTSSFIWMDHILETAKKVYGKDSINQEELDKILTVFIQAGFNRSEKSNIYIQMINCFLKTDSGSNLIFPAIH